MTSPEPSFKVERLGVGDWPDDAARAMYALANPEIETLTTITVQLNDTELATIAAWCEQHGIGRLLTPEIEVETFIRRTTATVFKNGRDT